MIHLLKKLILLKINIFFKKNPKHSSLLFFIKEKLKKNIYIINFVLFKEINSLILLKIKIKQSII
jgi:hypothetical protein